MGTNYSYQIKEYYGVNCYIPSDGRCFTKCFKKLYPYVMKADQMFDDFLFNNNRKGIMTNARLGQFNMKVNTNLTYYNEKNRHVYPKYMVNNNEVFSLPNIW